MGNVIADVNGVVGLAGDKGAVNINCGLDKVLGRELKDGGAIDVVNPFDL